MAAGLSRGEVIGHLVGSTPGPSRDSVDLDVLICQAAARYDLVRVVPPVYADPTEPVPLRHCIESGRVEVARMYPTTDEARTAIVELVMGGKYRLVSAAASYGT